MRSRLAALVVAVIAAAAPVAAQDSYRHGRIRHVEGGTLLQRATEPGTEEALPNFPFLPGDRIWTTENGRAEFQFPPMRVVRLDVRSTLDYVAHEDGEDDRNVLRLWSGAAFVHVLGDGEAAGLEIETPGGLVAVRERSVLRIDVAQGEARLSVYAGSAVLDTGRERRTLQAGERTLARFGEVERPQPFDTGELDAFARWDGEREARDASLVDARFDVYNQAGNLLPTNLDGSVLRNARLAGSFLAGASLAGADLSQANFSEDGSGPVVFATERPASASRVTPSALRWRTGRYM